jgi:hypothetical protein
MFYNLLCETISQALLPVFNFLPPSLQVNSRIFEISEMITHTCSYARDY